jgi:gluconate 5-dehydrogenase
MIGSRVRRVALVTGSTGGIGYGIARGLLAAGFDIVLNGRDRERLEASRRDLDDERVRRSYGNDVHAVAFDITDPAAVGSAIEQIEGDVGPIVALINNAGAVVRDALLDTGLDQWNNTLHTNVTGAFIVASSVAPRMIGRGRGKIVNIGSIQSAMARTGLGSYAAAKSALASLTRTMCVEWGPHNIQINTLAPGYVLTDMNAALRHDSSFSEWLVRRTPAGRWGNVEDVVGPAVWLCSEQSDFVNGQVIFADGGLSAGI